STGDFTTQYQARYRTPPSFSVVFTYESIKLFAQGVREANTTVAPAVKKSILQTNPFQGVYDTYTLDKYGDAQRQLALYRIENGTPRHWKAP
ncbi:MAG: ABC transporter substrate-binding protein, partial [Planctomycetota bacterium]